MIDKIAFDRIITHKDANKHIVANTYLHILSAHPDFIKKNNLSKKNKFWIPVRAKLVLIIRTFQSIFDGSYYCTRQKSVKSDVLFISHLTNKQQVSEDNDAYFGGLPSQLLQNGIGSSVILINHAKVSKQQVLTGWSGSSIPRFILGPSLGFLSEIKLYFAQRNSKQKLKSIIKDLKIDKELAKDALYNQLSPSTFDALRIAKQVTKIAEKTDAKFIITTYEGHAWERLVYYCARRSDPSIKCFGYQHAAVFMHQHAIKRLLSKQYNPDIILTSGKISQSIFRDSKLLENSKIICLGSPKHLKPKLILDRVDCCLVVPQGSVRECLYLFELSFAYAKKYNNQRFIWRLHPLLSFEKIKKYSTIFKTIPDNILLSEGDLDEDIQKSDSVLYRGSTAVINAINAGLKPIYYQMSLNEMNVDPIYQQHKGKEIVFNDEELRLAFNADIGKDAKQSLHNFAQNFYTPLDDQVLKDVML